MIHVVAILTAKPGKRAELLKHFTALLPLVHAEDGCIEYQPVVDVPGFGAFQTVAGPDVFLVVEKWRDEASLKLHAGAPHMMAYYAIAKELMAHQSVHVLQSAVPAAS